MAGEGRGAAARVRSSFGSRRLCGGGHNNNEYARKNDIDSFPGWHPGSVRGPGVLFTQWPWKRRTGRPRGHDLFRAQRVSDHHLDAH